MSPSTLDILSSRLPAVVDLRTAAKETGFAEQTIRNLLHLGRCPFNGYKEGSRWKFRLQDLAHYIDSRALQPFEPRQSAGRKRGRPTKKEQIARRLEAENQLSHRIAEDI